VVMQLVLRPRHWRPAKVSMREHLICPGATRPAFFRRPHDTAVNTSHGHAATDRITRPSPDAAAPLPTCARPAHSVRKGRLSRASAVPHDCPWCHLSNARQAPRRTSHLTAWSAQRASLLVLASTLPFLYACVLARYREEQGTKRPSLHLAGPCLSGRSEAKHCRRSTHMLQPRPKAPTGTMGRLRGHWLCASSAVFRSSHFLSLPISRCLCQASPVQCSREASKQNRV
jgi:hypothetical protein